MNKIEKATQWLEEYNIIPWDDIVQSLANLLAEHEKATIQACQESVNVLSRQMSGFEQEAQIVNDTLKYIKLG